MSDKHTPGELFSYLSMNDGWTIQHAGGWIANVYQSEPHRNAEANARRLAAAWNACAGISTDALEQGAVNALFAACCSALQLAPGWREAIAELEDHCGCEVRLKNMMAALDQIDEWKKEARAAIALAEGK